MAPSPFQLALLTLSLIYLPPIQERQLPEDGTVYLVSFCTPMSKTVL